MEPKSLTKIIGVQHPTDQNVNVKEDTANETMH